MYDCFSNARRGSVQGFLSWPGQPFNKLGAGTPVFPPRTVTPFSKPPPWPDTLAHPGGTGNFGWYNQETFLGAGCALPPPNQGCQLKPWLGRGRTVVQRSETLKAEPPLPFPGLLGKALGFVGGRGL